MKNVRIHVWHFLCKIKPQKQVHLRGFKSVSSAIECNIPSPTVIPFYLQTKTNLQEKISKSQYFTVTYLKKLQKNKSRNFLHSLHISNM